MFGKIIVVIIIITAIAAGYIFSSQKPAENHSDQVTPSQTNNNEPTVTTTQESGIKSSWIIVRDLEKISLHSNLEENLSAVEFKQKHGCSGIINGGFFSESNKHIGLFVSEGTQISASQNNALFNGYFSIKEDIPTISSSLPISPNIALQTGPLLFKDKNSIPLQIRNDEEARRMVLATTPYKEVIFMVFYDTSSLISGPKLADLPKQIAEIDKRTSLEVKDAINLDGGSHSAFISDDITLTDIQTPGSYFCLKS